MQSAVRRQLFILAGSTLLLILGIEAILHDGWGLFGNPAELASQRDRYQSVAARRGPQAPAPLRSAVPPSRPITLSPPMEIWAESSICSRERMQKFLDHIGSTISPQALIHLPNRGPLSENVIDPSLPAAILYPATDLYTNRWIFAFPVKSGQVPLSTFSNDPSMQLMKGDPDIACDMAQVGYMRTQHYLFMGGNPKTLRLLGDDKLKQYSDPTLLAAVKGDFDLLANHAPKQSKAVIDQFSAILEPKLLTPGTVEQLIQKQFHSIDLSLHEQNGVATIRIKTHLATRRPPTLYTRPALPEACFARFDFCFASAEEKHAAISSLLDLALQKAPPIPGTPQDKQNLLTFSDEAYNMLLGEASSIALQRSADGITAYAVMQFSQPKDIEAELAEFRPRVRKLLNLTDESRPWIISHYDDAAFHVLRVSMGEPVWYFDFIQKGNKRFISMSRSDARVVAGIASLKTEEDRMPVAHVSLSLPELRRFITQMKVKPLPDGAATFMDEHFNSGRVVISVKIDGQDITLDLAFPGEMLVSLLKVMPL